VIELEFQGKFRRVC